MTFTVSGFTYKSLKHVEFMFAYGSKKVVNTFIEEIDILYFILLLHWS